MLRVVCEEKEADMWLWKVNMLDSYSDGLFSVLTVVVDTCPCTWNKMA